MPENAAGGVMSEPLNPKTVTEWGVRVTWPEGHSEVWKRNKEFARATVDRLGRLGAIVVAEVVSRQVTTLTGDWEATTVCCWCVCTPKGAGPVSRACYLSTAELYRLDIAVTPLKRLTGFGGLYLVGSASERPDFRDVDVRMILSDERFDELFGDSDLWMVFSYAVSRWLAADTGLPIDFQVQRQTEANANHNGSRNALGLKSRDFAGLGDATPYYERTKAALSAAVPLKETGQ